MRYWFGFLYADVQFMLLPVLIKDMAEFYQGRGTVAVLFVVF